MKPHFYLYLVLFAMGASWGITPVLIKTAVNAGHQAMGMIVWTSVVGVVLSAIAAILKRQGLPLTPPHLRLYLGVALLGAVVPNYFNFTAAAHLPAGIMAIIIALVPMFAMPISLMLGFEKLSWMRVSGALLGAFAILLIVGPDTGLPESSSVVFVFVALLASACYGAEGNFLVWFGARGLGPMRIVFGAYIVGLLISAPIAFAAGQVMSPFMKWGLPEYAVLANGAISWGTYVVYIWLIGRAGPVFSSQVAYLVTGWGVVWSMMLLGERYSIWVWIAFVLMLIGVALVKPHDSEET